MLNGYEAQIGELQGQLEEARAELASVKQELADNEAADEKLAEIAKHRYQRMARAEADLSEALELLRIAELEWRQHMDELQRPDRHTAGEFNGKCWLCRAARLRERRGR